MLIVSYNYYHIRNFFLGRLLSQILQNTRVVHTNEYKILRSDRYYIILIYNYNYRLPNQLC